MSLLLAMAWMRRDLRADLHREIGAVRAELRALNARIDAVLLSDRFGRGTAP